MARTSWGRETCLGPLGNVGLFSLLAIVVNVEHIVASEGLLLCGTSRTSKAGLRTVSPNSLLGLLGLLIKTE